MKRRHVSIALTLMLTTGMLVAAAPAQAALTCFGKRPTIFGTHGDDKIRGTRGRDVIHARGGVDTVLGRGGNDRICLGHGGSEPAELLESARGGRGRDRIAGGEGADVLIGNRGKDRLFGGPGYDYINGRRGDDRIGDGGGRNGYLNGGHGNDTILGSNQDDYFIDSFGTDTIQARDGIDRIELRNTGDVDHIDGGLGGDVIFVGNRKEPEPIVVNLQEGFAQGERLGRDNLTGIEHVEAECQPCDITGNDERNGIYAFNLDATSGVVRGLGGDDLLEGQGLLEGGDGNDVIEGSGENDELIGGAGDDHFSGFVNNNLIDGGDGSDTTQYFGYSGVEVDLQAGWAKERDSDRTLMDTLVSIENVWGTANDDRLLGSDADNVLLGGPLQRAVTYSGDDFIDGRGGYDVLDGLTQIDTCINGEEVRNCEM